MKELIVASNPAKKRRSAAQKAATRKLVALNRRRGGTTRKRRTTTRRKTPAKRRRTTTTTTTTTRRRSPKRRRNPTLFGRGGMGRIVNSQVIPALVGGAGGVANDVLYGFLPLPMELQTGNFRHVGKAASALLLAWAASFVVTKRTADQIGAGALTVVGYNVVRELVGRFAPDINMGMFLDPEMGMFLDPSMGAYPSPGLNPDYPLAGMGAGHYSRRRGNAGVPGAGVVVPPQLAAEQPYGGWPATAGYADMDAGGYSEYQ